MTNNGSLRLPSADEAAKYYQLFVRILKDVAKFSVEIFQDNIRAARFAKLHQLHETVETIHGDYLDLLYEFDNHLRVAKVAHRDGRIDESKFIYDSALVDFRESSMGRRRFRGEAKSFAGAYIQSAADIHEARYLAAVLWYFQHSFSSGSLEPWMSEVESHFAGRGTNSEQTLDLEQQWDTASAFVDEQIMRLSESENLDERIERAREIVKGAIDSLTARLGHIVRYHYQLRKAWRLTAPARNASEFQA